MKVVGVHLFNDFSGSPLVFSEVLKGLNQKGLECKVITNQTQGFLSDLDNMSYDKIQYNWSTTKIKTLFYFLMAQWQIFWKIFADKDANLIYINTILPFGAAIAAKLKGKKVVYHIHETSVKPLLLKKFLFKVIETTAHQSIYVSHFLKEQESVKGVENQVVYNALPKEFSQKAKEFKRVNNSFNPFRVLMLCSLKDYKGINEFLALSKFLPQVEFDLVLNAEESAIKKWLEDKKTPVNLTWYPVQSDVHPFYKKANIVLNLSRPDGWIETFGMTALEAMVYGLPVIVPPVGGIAELVEDEINGFHVDCRNTIEIAQKIEQLLLNEDLYNRISNNAKERALQFSPKLMGESVYKIIAKILNAEPSIFQNTEKNLKIEKTIHYN